MLLEDLSFSDCSLSSRSSPKAIIKAEYGLNDPLRALRLQQVAFRNNNLNDSVAILIPAASNRTSLQMINVDFRDNVCFGLSCFAFLSSNNHLENVIIQGNRQITDSGNIPALLQAPEDSSTHAKGIEAIENAGSCILLGRGSLTVEHALFVDNDASSTNSSACLHLMHAHAELKNCAFENNRAKVGAAISATNSTLILSSTVIEGNSGLSGGGVFLSMSSSLSMMKECVFSKNHASKYGGGIWSNFSWITGDDVTFANNSADDNGGGIYCQQNSHISISNGRFVNNNASSGASVKLTKASNGEFDNCSFTDNVASSSGAGSSTEHSQMELTRCSFLRNRANFGGSINCMYSNFTATDCRFEDGEANISGGVGQIQESRIVMDRCNFTKNTAMNGGAIYAWKSIIDITDGSFEKSEADQEGGAIFILECSMSINGSNFSASKATYGGALFGRKSQSVVLDHCSFAKGVALETGGAIDMRESDMTATNLICTENAANSFGGCLHGKSSSHLSLEDFVVTENQAETGGALSTVDASATCKNGIFSKNQAHRNGGAISVDTSVSRNNTPRSVNNENANAEVCAAADADAVLKNVTFLRNSGKDGGSVYVSYSAISIAKSNFTEGNATHGGFLASSGDASVSVCDSTFTNAVSTTNGGCLAINEGRLLMDGVTLENCRCSEQGGAVFLKEALAEITNSDIQSNHANTSGGAIYSTQAPSFTVQHSSFENNWAKYGGGACCARMSTGTFANVAFMDNSASENGGCLVVEQNARVDITNSTLRNAQSSGSGGFISVTKESHVVVQHASMINGTAKEDGGAVAVTSSNFSARHLTVRQCSASGNGGALKAKQSTVLCVNCTLQSNMATGKGGAISFDAVDGKEKLKSQLFGSKIVKNTADIGGIVSCHKTEAPSAMGFPLGGLSFESGSNAEECLENGEECAFVTLLGTEFQKNKAVRCGGAIFAGYLEAIRYNCSIASSEAHSAFLGEESKMSRRIGNSTELCPTWTGNAAGKYGHTLAMYPAMAEMTLKTRTSSARVRSGEEYVIQEYRIGTPLPEMEVQLLDSLFQNASISYHDITATLSATEQLLVGNVSLQVMGESHRFPAVVGYGAPGNYSVDITFNEKAIKTITIIVTVPSCVIGEITDEVTGFCSQCSSSTYCFDPSSHSCKSCPENGICETNAITPKDGYWHWAPCSKHLQKCLTSYACKFEDRSETLKDMTRNITSCGIGDEQRDKYQQHQCAEVGDLLNWLKIVRDSLCLNLQGHTGPLCGSCKSSYGSHLSSKCKACPTSAGNVSVIVVSAVILLTLSGITIRGTLTVFGSKDFALSYRSRLNQLVGHATHRLQQSADAIEANMLHNGNRGSERNLEPKGVEASSSILAKWKAIEMFKVT